MLNFPRGSQQETRSDTYFFNSIPSGFMCGVWVALENIHPDSGPLLYSPGRSSSAGITNADLQGGDRWDVAAMSTPRRGMQAFAAKQRRSRQVRPSDRQRTCSMAARPSWSPGVPSSAR